MADYIKKNNNDKDSIKAKKDEPTIKKQKATTVRTNSGSKNLKKTGKTKFSGNKIYAAKDSSSKKKTNLPPVDDTPVNNKNIVDRNKKNDIAKNILIGSELYSRRLDQKDKSEKIDKSPEVTAAEEIKQNTRSSFRSPYILASKEKNLINRAAQGREKQEFYFKKKNETVANAKVKKKEIKNELQLKKSENNRLKSKAIKYSHSQNERLSINLKFGKENIVNTGRASFEITKENVKIVNAFFKGLISKINYKSLLIISAVFGALTLLIIAGSIVSLVASPFGILFSDYINSDYSLESAIATINDEFAEKIDKIEEKTNYDSLIFSNAGCGKYIANWSDIIAVWDVKLNIGEGQDVVDIDEHKFQELRRIVWDMVSISSTKDVTVTETTTVSSVIEDINDWFGIETTTQPIETHTKLIISVSYSSIDDMCTKYHFDKEQEKTIYDLISDEDYIKLFAIDYFEADLSNFDFGDEETNDQQKKVVSVALNASKYGISAKSGYCQAWVADVYWKALGGTRKSSDSALTAGYLWSVSRDFSQIQVGATVYGNKNAVNGHVGIYIGNGQVIHNASSCVKIESLQSWIKKYSGSKPCCWGWNGGVNLSGKPEYQSVGGLIS